MQHGNVLLKKTFIQVTLCRKADLGTDEYLNYLYEYIIVILAINEALSCLKAEGFRFALLNISDILRVFLKY
jgi:hypothetical protein